MQRKQKKGSKNYKGRNSSYSNKSQNKGRWTEPKAMSLQRPKISQFSDKKKNKEMS
jgi:hypothetical protein